MADRRVEIEYALRDTASAAMDKIVDRANLIGAAAAAAQNNLNQMAQSGGLNPRALLATQVASRQIERAVQRDLAQTLFGPGQGGVSPEARQSMDAQRNRVRLAEQLNRDQAAFELRQERAAAVARREQGVVGSRTAAQRRRAGGPADLDEWQAEDDRIAAGLGGRGGGGVTAGRYQNPLAGTGFARIATPLFALHAVSQLMESVGKELVQSEGQVKSFGASIDSMTRSLAEGIPIVGGFARGLVDIFEAATGVGGDRAGNTRFLATQAGRLGTQTAIRGAELNAAGQLAGVNRLAGNAAIEAQAAREFAGSLTPDALAGFRPRPRFGEATEQTGELRFRAAEAENQAEVARRQALAERGRFDQFEAGLGLEGKRGRVAMYQADADRAASAREAADIALRNKGSVVGGLFRDLAGGVGVGGARGGGAAEVIGQNAALDRAADAARTNEIAKQNQLIAAQKDLKGALASVDEQRKALLEAETNAAQKQLQLAQANLAVAKDRLTTVSQQVEAGRQGAQFLGAARPGEVLALERALDRANDDPTRRLSDRERSLIGGYGPAGQDFLRQRDEARGRDNPAFARIQEKLGQPTLPALEEQQAQLQDELRKVFAESQAAFREGIAAPTKEFAADMAGVIREFLATAIAQFKTELGLGENKAARDLAGQQR